MLISFILIFDGCSSIFLPQQPIPTILNFYPLHSSSISSLDYPFSQLHKLEATQLQSNAFVWHCHQSEVHGQYHLLYAGRHILHLHYSLTITYHKLDLESEMLSQHFPVPACCFRSICTIIPRFPLKFLIFSISGNLQIS